MAKVKLSKQSKSKKLVAKKTTQKTSKVLKAVKKSAKKAKAAKKKKWKYEHSPDHYNRSEEYLIQNLDEELKDAWTKIREFGASLGEQRIYASGKAIMFSKKVCYFFVRPKKKYLETVIFLTSQRNPHYFKSIRPVSKTKFAHTFNLVHADQVEGELAEALQSAFAETPSA